MKKLLALLVACSLTGAPTAFAQCKKPVTLLEQGDPSPCRGYLFTPEKELELRLLNEEYKFLEGKLLIRDQQIDLYKQQITNYDDMLDLERQKSEMWRKTAEHSTLELTKKEERQATRDWVMILTGVGLTVLAGWAVGQASK